MSGELDGALGSGGCSVTGRFNHGNGVANHAAPCISEWRTLKEARQTTRQFGACVVNRAPGRAQLLMNMSVDAPRYVQSLNAVASDECLDEATLRMPIPLMRSAIMEALYRRNFGHVSQDFGDVPPMDYTAGYKSPLSSTAASVTMLAQFGDCLTRADAPDARALILAMPASSTESAALAGLSPHMGACISKDQRVTFSRSMLRAAVAEGLYRLSVAKSVMATKG